MNHSMAKGAAPGRMIWGEELSVMSTTVEGISLPLSPLVMLKISNLTNKYPKKYPKRAFPGTFLCWGLLLAPISPEEKEQPDANGG